MTTDPSAADPAGGTASSSDMEQALDEILSGVHALLQTAPKAATVLPAQGIASQERVHEHAAMQATPSADGVTRVLMAVLAASPHHAAAVAAQRWIQHELFAQTLALGFLGGERFATVRVSPLMHGRLAALAAEGATLKECNAWSLTWEWPNATQEGLRRVFGRLVAAVCLDQNQNPPALRIPRIPERLAVRTLPVRDPEPEGRAAPRLRFALIDQDNAQALPSTLFWFPDGGFVPDHVCALTLQDGLWCPVLRSFAE